MALARTGSHPLVPGSSSLGCAPCPQGTEHRLPAETRAAWLQAVLQLLDSASAASLALRKPTPSFSQAKSGRCSSSCTLERVRFTPKADVTSLKDISRLGSLGLFFHFSRAHCKSQHNILSAIVFVGPARSDYTENQDTDILSLFCLARQRHLTSV